MAYELRFDPRTIEHLGVKMYSTLPPALAELISNAYDADASEVIVEFHELNGQPKTITVSDNGTGMGADDIQNKFLVIGRNRRNLEGDKPSTKYKRLPTGKKGLGKLALFGLAEEIVFDTAQGGKRNRFKLDWNALLKSESVYQPESEVQDEDTKRLDGTYITLRQLKRKSSFDLEATADSLSKLFIVDNNFKIILKNNNGQTIEITNERRYQQIEHEFSWDKTSLELNPFEYLDSIEFNLITSKTPVKPSSGLRGITIFSRGKLVNAPEFFSNSTSSHFYQYLTGWIKADFIDLLDEDVISTNRQSINWENEKMAQFREWLNELVTKVGISWREKRKDKKDDDFREKTGIDKQKWFATLPENIKKLAEKIVNTMSDDEGVDTSYNPVVQALHELIPEYPALHWRHLHPEIRDASAQGYISQNYYAAFLESVKRYANRTREYAGVTIERDLDLMGNVFGSDATKILKVAVGYLRVNGTNFATSTTDNIENAQRMLSQGIISGGRNVVAHEEAMDLSVSGLFSEKDCLDLLSLISHLMCRIEVANNYKHN
ncbi:TIGR02391 family protein [Arenimonas sp.]|nr:TIGR02391 family protein [Candidatus Parcubacteria bacterium]